MTINEPLPGTVDAPSKPRSSIALIIISAFQRWQRNRAIATLQSLSDGVLEDIGIARNDIPRIVDDLSRKNDTAGQRSAHRG